MSARARVPSRLSKQVVHAQHSVALLPSLLVALSACVRCGYLSMDTAELAHLFSQQKGGLFKAKLKEPPNRLQVHPHSTEEEWTRDGLGYGAVSFYCIPLSHACLAHRWWSNDGLTPQVARRASRWILVTTQ